MNLLERIKLSADTEYLKFLPRTIKTSWPFLGVRMPILKKIAKEYANNIPNNFKPQYYEEVIVYGLSIVYSKLDISEKCKLLEDYIKFIDNWALCDSIFMGWKLKKNELQFVWDYFIKLRDDSREYYVRTLVVLFISNYMKDDYIDGVLCTIKQIKSGAYYVDMALAWIYTEALIKFQYKALQVVKTKSLSKFVQNKTIQKARESFRVSSQIKKELLNYKL